MACRIVVLGASLGGTRALEQVLGGLPAAYAPPVAVVLHGGPGQSGGLLAHLVYACPLRIVEPDDKQPRKPHSVCPAPPDYHLLIEPFRLALPTEAPVNSARPSVDVLSGSAANAFGSDVVAVVLTATGRDGAYGSAAVHADGGLLIVQNPGTSAASAMPQAALAACPAD